MSSRLRRLTHRNMILAGCVVVLGIVLAVRADTVTSVDRENLPAVFPDLQQDQIRRIELSRDGPNGPERIQLEAASGGNSWALTSHHRFPTQAGAARLLDAVAAARDRGVATQRQDMFERFAGDGGWIRVKLTDLQGRETHNFAIGNYKYPETFIRLGAAPEERVIRALNLSPGVARTDVRSWIETRLWPKLSSNNAVRIDVEQRRDERTITLVKRGTSEADAGMAIPPKAGAEEGAKDEGWYMASPEPGEGKSIATEDLLRQFTGILIEDIVAGDAEGNAAVSYGFDKPELVVTLWHRVGDRVTKNVLLVGDKVEGKDEWYVQRKGARWVFTVGASSLSRMRQMPSTFREADPEPAKDDGAKDEPKKDAPDKDD